MLVLSMCCSVHFSLAQSENDSTLSSKSFVVPNPVVSKPTANFSSNRTCIYNSPNFLYFFNFSSKNVNYEWKFEGGEPSSYSGWNPPPIKYNENGIYDVQLVAYNDAGADTMLLKEYVTVGHSLDFAANITASSCGPLMTYFKDISKGCIVAWEWDFGDDSPYSRLEKPRHIYTKPGIYDVRLIATFEDGGQDTLVRKEYINLSELGGSFQMKNKMGCTNDSVYFEIYANGNIILEPEAGEMIFANKESADEVPQLFKIAYKYTKAGKYTPIVRTMNNEGCMAILPSAGEITIYEAPKPHFIADMHEGVKELTVHFSINESSPSANNKYEWIFNSSENDFVSNSNEKNPTITFTQSGSYNATLIAENEQGCKTMLKKESYIKVDKLEDAFMAFNISSDNAIMMYPDEDAKNLNVSINSLSQQTVVVQLYDEEGNILAQKSEVLDGLKLMTISTSDLLKEPSSVKITSENGVLIAKRKI